MPMVMPDEEMRVLLATVRRIAVVGLSNRLVRPSYGVADYLQRQGYESFPVNPTLLGECILQRRVYGALGDLPEPPDIDAVFRWSMYVADVVEQAMAAGAKALWTAARRAERSCCAASLCGGDAGRRGPLHRYRAPAAGDEQRTPPRARRRDD